MDNPQGTKRKGILEMRGVGVRTSSHGRFSARGGSVKVNVEKMPHATSKKSRDKKTGGHLQSKSWGTGVGQATASRLSWEDMKVNLPKARQSSGRIARSSKSGGHDPSIFPGTGLDEARCIDQGAPPVLKH